MVKPADIVSAAHFGLLGLETVIGRLLAVGNAVSTGLLTAGLGLWVATGPDGVAPSLLHAGLIALMGTPVLRVIISFAAFVEKRDWFFAAITMGVLLVLAASVFVALQQ